MMRLMNHVFIIESLDLDDEKNNRYEGKFFSQILHLGGKESTYQYVQTKQDFSKVTEGIVLVIPFSDVSWTPIFMKVGAVVSESGGMLSHSAIIARELSIPSIVGVKGACKLGDGRKVFVDGFSGKSLLSSLN